MIADGSLNSVYQPITRVDHPHGYHGHNKNDRPPCSVESQMYSDHVFWLLVNLGWPTLFGLG